MIAHVKECGVTHDALMDQAQAHPMVPFKTLKVSLKAAQQLQAALPANLIHPSVLQALAQQHEPAGRQPGYPPYLMAKEHARVASSLEGQLWSCVISSASQAGTNLQPTTPRPADVMVKLLKLVETDSAASAACAVRCCPVLLTSPNPPSTL